jgi:hypothetical protein
MLRDAVWLELFEFYKAFWRKAFTFISLSGTQSQWANGIETAGREHSSRAHRTTLVPRAPRA